MLPSLLAGNSERERYKKLIIRNKDNESTDVVAKMDGRRNFLNNRRFQTPATAYF